MTDHKHSTLEFLKTLQFTRSVIHKLRHYSSISFSNDSKAPSSKIDKT